MKQCIFACLLVGLVVGVSIFSPANQASSAVGNVLGWIDTVREDTGGTYITGWACQQGVSESINIHIYASGPAGSGTIVRGATTNVQQPANAGMNILCGTTNVKHQYKVYISNDDLEKYQGQKIYVHGLRKVGTVPNSLLNGSGNFTFPKPKTDPPPNPLPSGGDILGWVDSDRFMCDKGTGMWIYRLSEQDIKNLYPAGTMSNPLKVKGKMGSLHGDLLPLIEKVILAAEDKSAAGPCTAMPPRPAGASDKEYFKGWGIGSALIGYETTGLYDFIYDIYDFNLVAKRKADTVPAGSQKLPVDIVGPALQLQTPEL